MRIWLAYLRKEAMGGVGMKAQIFRYKVSFSLFFPSSLLSLQFGRGRERRRGEDLRRECKMTDGECCDYIGSGIWRKDDQRR